MLCGLFVVPRTQIVIWIIPLMVFEKTLCLLHVGVCTRATSKDHDNKKRGRHNNLNNERWLKMGKTDYCSLRTKEWSTEAKSGSYGQQVVQSKTFSRSG